MSKRRIFKTPTEFRNGDDASIQVKCYFDSETREYTCKLFINEEHYEPADYFTDDKNDAIDTSRAMVANNAFGPNPV